MAIKINTAYKEILTSAMLNEKISGIVGGNEKVTGFDVSAQTSTSVTIKPGRAYVNGCSIEETSDTRNILLDNNVLSGDGIVYIVLEYIHETKTVTFSCKTELNSNMVKLATLIIRGGVIAELINHESINTLNTVIGESADLEAQKIRDSIPSGFVELGQLDYTYMLNSENTVKIKGKSVAYVNGYRVEIPAGTIIDIGKAPKKESREDLLFLEAWKDSDFTKNGKLKWRVRHVAGVDFDTLALDGFNKADGSVEGNNTNGLTLGIVAQGGNIKPVNPSTLVNSDLRLTWAFKSSTGYISEQYRKFNDRGLYYAGISSNTNFSKQQLKTLDGFVYAIPMFRVYRKPSCGKSAPFEYSKLNPVTDYSKFAKLVSAEKVERVVSDNIKGRSVLNLIDFKQFAKSSNYSFDYKTNTITTPANDNRGWINVPMSVPVVQNKTYSLIADALDGSTDIELGSADSSLFARYSIMQKGVHVQVFTVTPNVSAIGVKAMDKERAIPKRVRLMILEGDWTNKKLPEFFTGLKSLGQDDGNIVTVKNGILSNDTYDINDGNQKLITFSGVTHVLSDNTITPTIEASIKKGQQQTPLNKLGTKLTVDGAETIEFAAIKGKTLQNCYPAIVRNSFSALDGSIEDGYVILKGSGSSFRNAFIHVDQCLIKPNTAYTMVVNVTENTLTQDLTLASMHSADIFNSNVRIARGVRGTHKFVVTSVSQITNGMFGLCSFLSSSETGQVRFKIMLVEGNHTNTPLDELPFVEGVKSVGETESNTVILSSCGKNLLYRDSTYASRTWQANLKYNEDGTFTVTKSASSGVYYAAIRYKCKLKEGKRYKLSLNVVSGKLALTSVCRSANHLVTTEHNAGTFIAIDPCTRDCDYIDVLIYTNSEVTVGSVQIEESDSVTAYQAHSRYKQNIYLKEPLRGLPNGVCDEIRGNKIIKKVGKLFINGSESWSVANTRNNTVLFSCRIPDIVVDKTGNRMPICDKILPGRIQSDVWVNDVEGVSYTDLNSGHLRISVLKSKLSTQDRDGLKTWLSQNPLTIYYELANPAVEYLENVYEKESIKTYQLDAPLRGLPNGVQDEIKDGVLIRRCWEFTVKPNGYDYKQTQTLTNTILINLYPGSAKGGTVSINDKLPSHTNYDLWSRDIEGVNVYYNGSHIQMRILKSRLDGLDVADINKWLNENPIKIIYQLSTPIETLLTEVEPQYANFSPSRQFAEGNWLRKLPNGVRDTVENGKVIRRIKKLVLDGNARKIDWVGTAANAKYFGISFETPGSISNGISVVNSAFLSLTHEDGNNNRTVDDGREYIHPWANSSIGMRILASRLSSATNEGVLQWLSNNPITILYELAIPVEEPLTIDNYMPYPCHDFNTYCGSMYVGENRNNTLNENSMPSETPVTIETDFRKVTGKMNVEDCRYKKVSDGYDSAYYIGDSSNLFAGFKNFPLNSIEYTMEKCSNANRFNGYPLFKPGKTYYVKFKYRRDTTTTRKLSLWIKDYITDEKQVSRQVSPANTNNEVIGQYYVCEFSFTYTGVNVGYMQLNFETNEAIHSLTLSDISVVEGTTAKDFVLPTTHQMYYENTTENDIEDLRHQVSLTGFDYNKVLNESFDKLLRGEL